MDHQDWKTVVLRKPQAKKPPPSSAKVPVSGLNSNNNFNGTGKKIKDDDEIKKLPNVGIEIGKQISQARTSKKISQKQLATMMNVQVQIVQQNENGKALRNNALLAKFERVLGVKFKR